jgi:hypothetical protein
MSFTEIINRLKEPFPPELHVERDLPGGGKWFYVTWQRIRERLDDVCPEWRIEYGTPFYLDKYCVVSCKLTIAGISREALGNAEIELLSKTGKDMSRGTAIERALADAFKNAAEAFGVCRYLDEQSKDKREFTIRYLQAKGDGRGVKVAAENGWLPGNLNPEATEARKRAEFAAKHPLPKSAASAKPMPARPAPVHVEPLTTNRDRFIRLRTLTGHASEQVKTLCQELNIPPAANSLNAAQCLQLRDAMLTDWAMGQQRFKHLNHAQNSFNNVLASFEQPPDDDQLWVVWETKVLEKPVLEATTA